MFINIEVIFTLMSLGVWFVSVNIVSPGYFDQGCLLYLLEFQNAYCLIFSKSLNDCVVCCLVLFQGWNLGLIHYELIFIQIIFCLKISAHIFFGTENLCLS